MKYFIALAMLATSLGASAQSQTTSCVPAPYVGLYNISTRGVVGTKSEQLIGGFIIRANHPDELMCVVIRARGLSLPDTIPNRLEDPRVRLVDQRTSTVIEVNDNWLDHPEADLIEALFPGVLAPQDAAIFTCLPPGGYTAVMSGVGGTTGTGIVEVFDIEFDDKLPEWCTTEIIIMEEILVPHPVPRECPIDDDDDDDDSSDDDDDSSDDDDHDD